MASRKLPACVVCVIALSLAVLPAAAQTGRGKSELNAAGGKITVDYGRPQLKGRDPLTWQKDGAYWRMGSNDMTTLTTPAGLAFGSTKLPKGTYGLWLLKVSNDRYELVFNSDISGHGMNHDKAKDVGSVVLKKEVAASPVETFTIELSPAPGGGSFVMSWGTVKLSFPFRIIQ